MTDHPMSLEFDWASNAYRARLGDALMSIEHSFGTLAAARHGLHLIGLRIGAKIDGRTWRVEFTEPVAEHALESGPTGSPVKRPEIAPVSSDARAR
jgi:hypothetical protein